MLIVKLRTKIKTTLLIKFKADISNIVKNYSLLNFLGCYYFLKSLVH